MSLNTVYHCIKERHLKLHYAKRKTDSINSMQKRHHILWARARLRWSERQWRCVLCGQAGPRFSLFSGGNARRGLHDKKTKWTIQTFFSERCRSQHLLWYGGCFRAHSESTIDAEAYIGILGRHQGNLVSQEVHGCFSNTGPGLIPHTPQECGFVDAECVCLTGLPTVQIGLLVKHFSS